MGGFSMASGVMGGLVFALIFGGLGPLLAGVPLGFIALPAAMMLIIVGVQVKKMVTG